MPCHAGHAMLSTAYSMSCHATSHPQHTLQPKCRPSTHRCCPAPAMPPPQRTARPLAQPPQASSACLHGHAQALKALQWQKKDGWVLFMPSVPVQHRCSACLRSPPAGSSAPAKRGPIAPTRGVARVGQDHQARRVGPCQLGRQPIQVRVAAAHSRHGRRAASRPVNECHVLSTAWAAERQRTLAHLPGLRGPKATLCPPPLICIAMRWLK